jgi:hypothetical protein
VRLWAVRLVSNGAGESSGRFIVAKISLWYSAAAAASIILSRVPLEISQPVAVAVEWWRWRL